MIRKTMILLWMLFPVGAAAYHFNYGPKHEARERAYRRLCEIQAMEQVDEPEYAKIIEQYHLLSEDLPPDEEEMVRCQIRLAVCRARMEMLDLDKAVDELTRLLQETAALYGENARMTRAVREQLGKAFYYATWVLKTNNVPEDEWRPYAERSRQLFRFLAEWDKPLELECYQERVQSEFQKTLDSLPGADTVEQAQGGQGG